MPRLAPVMRMTGSGTLRFRIDRRGQFVPDFDLVAVGIGREEIWLAGHKLAVLVDPAAGLLLRASGGVDVLRMLEPEAEVRDSAGGAGAFLLLLEHEDVARSGRLKLDEAVALVDLDGAEHLAVELRRARDVTDRQGEMRQAIRLDHARLT